MSENGSSQPGKDNIWNHLPKTFMDAPNMFCFEKRFDNGWADLKIKFDR